MSPPRLRVVQLHIFLPQHAVAGQQILQLAVAAERDGVGMFAEQQYVVERSGFARGDHPLLQGVGFRPPD